MALTFKDAMFPALILIFITLTAVGIGAFASIVGAKGIRQMATDDWIAALLVTDTSYPVPRHRLRRSPSLSSHQMLLVLTQAGSTVWVGLSFHMLPMNHGEVGTTAICILMPFGGLAVLMIHLLTTLSTPLLGAFLPRVAMSPGIVYGVVVAWRSLLEMEATVFNMLLVLWVAFITLGWVAAGWFADNPETLNPAFAVASEMFAST
jgi:hypothetical protein